MSHTEVVQSYIKRVTCSVLGLLSNEKVELGLFKENSLQKSLVNDFIKDFIENPVRKVLFVLSSNEDSHNGKPSIVLFSND